MESLYVRIRERARQIASHFPAPLFYREQKEANRQSRFVYETDPLVAGVRHFVRQTGDEDFGHGLKHAEKVALDAGTLMVIEGAAAGYTGQRIKRRISIAQCAGLLHDLKRKDTEHAAAGADHARQVLQRYPVAKDEVRQICQAIRNHEAFRKPTRIGSPEGLLLSNCLYDADKFRWGPDNFTDTLWDMVAFKNPPVSEFIRRYPAGMASLKRIRSSFRTEAGQRYGPGFIDIGLKIGEQLYDVILTEFAEHL